MSGKYAMLTFIGMQFTGALIVKLAGFLMATLSYQWFVLTIKLLKSNNFELIIFSIIIYVT